MKLMIAMSLLLSVSVEAQTGRTIHGPDTINHPSYPNSGPLRNRSNDMTGRDMSNATKMGSDQSPIVPGRNPVVKSKKKSPVQTGPFRDDDYDFAEEGSDGREAQEAAEVKSFNLTEKQIKKRQDPLWKSGKNLPDRHDQNEVPAELEERQNEEVNLTDKIDENQTPDVMEKRMKNESWREDYSDKQYDDPEAIKNRGE